MVGCLGLGEPCSQECEDKVLQCVEEGNVSTAKKRARTFKTCMSESSLESLECPTDCAPTFKMLAASQTPKTAKFSKFGDVDEEAIPRPATSRCNAEEQLDPGFNPTTPEPCEDSWTVNKCEKIKEKGNCGKPKGKKKCAKTCNYC